MYNVTLRRVYKTTVCCGKAILHISVCVCVCEGGGVDARAQACACARVASLIQHATRHHIVISGSNIFLDTRPYIINGTIFGKKVIEHEMCILMFSIALFQTFFILRRI